MACRATRRERVLVSHAVHPHYRQRSRTYFGGGLELDEIPLVADGPSRRHDRPRRARAPAGRGRTRRSRASSPASRTSSACSSRWPRSAGSPTPRARCSSPSSSRSRSRSSRRPARTAPTSRPARASRSGSRRSTAGRISGSSPSTDALVRQIPGRLVGMTTDLDGKRAYVMTLRAREQDIRRDKAASNICTNQALLALAASIYVATIGPHGLRDVAALGAARAAELEAALAAVGAPRLHPGPYLNEFAVRVPNARAVHRRLLDRGVLAGPRPRRRRARRPDPRRRAARLRDGGHDRRRDRPVRGRARASSPAGRRSVPRPGRRRSARRRAASRREAAR